MFDRISIRAVVIAFLAVLGLDFVLSNALLVMMAGDSLKDGMSDDDKRKVIEAIGSSSGFLLYWLVFGTSTTIAGGYLAARLAKTFPYYNGLAVGIVGFIFALFFLGQAPVWFDAIGMITTIPASIYGAHLQKSRAQGRDGHE
jgi:cytochrome c biogenesis protein CcdA